jgi:hypothetical protein
MTEVKLYYTLGEESKDSEGRTVIALEPEGEPIPTGAKVLWYGPDWRATKPTIVIGIELSE